MNRVGDGQLCIFKPNMDNDDSYLTFKGFLNKNGSCSPYMGVRVNLATSEKAATVGSATFRIGAEVYASTLEWYGPYFGFTAQALEQLPAMQKTPEALGKTILERLSKVGEQYFTLSKAIKPKITFDSLWRSQLKKTVNFIQRNPALLQHTPAAAGAVSTKIKKGGVVKYSSVDNHDCGSPGFTLIKGASGRLYLKMGTFFRETRTKRFLLDFEILSKTFCIRKMASKSSQRPQCWEAEMHFARKLKQAEAEGVDLTGILCPLDVLENEIMEPQGREDIINLLNDNNASLEERAKIAFEISKGLSTMHVLKSAHRDVKPENVLVMPDGSYRLIDFEFISRSETFNNGLARVGTRGYEPPEYLDIGKLKNSFSLADIEKRLKGDYFWDARKIDSWTYGILLFEIYCGFPPDFFDNIEESNFLSLIKHFSDTVKMRNLPEPVKEILISLFEISWEKRMHVTEASERLRQLHVKP